MKDKYKNYSGIKIYLIGLFGSLILRLVNYTLRWEKIGLSGEDKWWADSEPCILLFWHGRQLFMPWIYLNHRRSKNAPAMAALISNHNDGRMIASGMNFLGIDSVAGSSSHGGLKALFHMVKKLKNNSHVAITPDGPKGPVNKLKNGALIVAQKSGALIHPSAFSAESYWKFKSWDGMVFPVPFSRAVMIKGRPIAVDPNLTECQFDQLTLDIESSLNDVTSRADNYYI